MTCNTYGIRYSDAIHICEAAISIFHLYFIRENDLLDIVVIVSDNWAQNSMSPGLSLRISNMYCIFISGSITTKSNLKVNIWYFSL